MKKIITLLLTLTIIASLFVLPSSALTEADVAGFKYTLVMQASNGMSFTGDDVLFFGKYCMRGMAISPDGKYAFGGYLNPNGSSAIEMSDLNTGKVVAGLQFIQSENGKSSYPKGLATDDRGYLYAALAWNPNNTRADIATYTYANSELKQVGYANIVMTSESVKTGVNGITIEKINGSYFAYVIVNYDVDYLARFNVDDPTNPVLDAGFGNGGLIDLQKSPYNLTEANYLDVDTDGTIYLGCKDSSAQKLIVLSADGSIILNSVEQTKAYGVAIWNDYLFVTSQDSGKVCVYNKSALSLIGTIEVTTENIALPIDRDDILFNGGVSSLCNATVINDVLFLGDQGNGASGFDQIFAVGLTADGAKIVENYSKGIHDRLASIYPEKTEAPETTLAPEPETTVAPEATETPVETTEEAIEDVQTNAPAVTDAPATEAPAKEKGCGGMVAGIAIIAIIGTAVVIRKKD